MAYEVRPMRHSECSPGAHFVDEFVLERHELEIGSSAFRQMYVTELSLPETHILNKRRSNLNILGSMVRLLQLGSLRGPQPTAQFRSLSQSDAAGCFYQY